MSTQAPPVGRYIFLLALLLVAAAGGYLLGSRSRSANPPAPAAAPETAPAVPRDVALDAVRPDAFMVVTVKVPKVWDHAEFASLRTWAEGGARRPLAEVYGFTPSELDRATFVVYHPAQFREPDLSALESTPLFFTARSAADAAAIVKRCRQFDPDLIHPQPVVPDVPPVPGATLAFQSESTLYSRHLTVIDPTSFFVTSRWDGPNLPFLPYSYVAPLVSPAASGPLSPALAAARQHAVVVGLNVPKLATHMAALKMDTTRFANVLTASSAVITADFEDALAVRAVVTFADEPTAARAKPELEALLALWAADLDGKREKSGATALLEWAAGVLRGGKLEVSGSTLVVAARLPYDDAFRKAVAALLATFQEQSSYGAAKTRLQQLLLAMHNYESANGVLPPPGSSGPPPGGFGASNWSWRLHLLPYLEEDNIYRQLNPNLSWDHPDNLKFLEKTKMPKAFEHPNRPAPPNHTYFRVFVRPPKTKGISGPVFLAPDGRTKLADISDGTSNTILIVEARTPVLWYKPDELPFDAELPLPELGDPKARVFLAGMADGTVRVLPQNLNKDILKALITRAGGEVIEKLP